MRQNRKLLKLFLGSILVIVSLVLLNIYMQEVIAKCIIGFVVIVAIVITIVKGLEINGMSDIFAVILLEAAPVFIHFFSDIPFIYNVTGVYKRIAQFVCLMIGKDTIVNISEEMGVTITVALIFVLFEVWNYNKDRTAMKVLRRSKDEELEEKNFTEKSEMFCKTLRQWLEEMNRETNWNEEQFTPLEAEVEVDNGGKRKKKYEDLIKCLKNNRRHGTVYLVLGSPGSGKSVSMRKLCLDLLKESKRTKKIPVYINLKEWNEDWNLDCMPEKKDLIAFIRKTFEAKADFSTEGFLNEYFQRMLDDGRWYFVFDSFDEIPCFMGKKNCQELIDGISALLYQFMTGPNQGGGVVASRLYKAPSSAVGATVTLKIQEFSDIKIKTMLKKYLIHYEEVIKLLFNGRDDLVSLCRNPFYLALLTNYILDRGPVLPENQMELYHTFIDGRLKKCAGKLEKEGMNESEIYQAAKELASFMQETKECGLECPTRLLYRREDETNWRKVFALLRYAKICRLGGRDETISFVHRRFQEFFLVENIIDQKQVIGYENYRDILNDVGMRDALVLYCEVVEEEKAREIANFCWKTIQDNIKFANNIHARESQELVCALYFMKEAFRNRKQVLSNFVEDFYKLVKKILDKDKDAKDKNDNTDKENIRIDYVIMLALVNSMILFSKTQLKDLVLIVFRMNNRWFNDVIVQNCRALDTLGYHIENRFVRYFGQMDIRIFLKRFFDTRFSLSVSEKFRYVRKMHFMIMILDLACVLMTILIGALALISLFEFLLYRGIPQTSISSTIFSFHNLNMGNNMEILFIEIIILLVSLTIVVLCTVSLIGYFKFFPIQSCLLFIETCLCMLFLFIMESSIIEYVVITIFIIIIMAAMAKILLFIHDFRFYISNKEIAKKALIKYTRELVKNLPLMVFMLVMIPIFSFYDRIFDIIGEVFSIVLIICFIFILVYLVLHYLSDRLWLRKHSVELKYIQRTQLESNLDSIYFDEMKYKYLEQLLLQNVELIDVWSDNIRPQYRDDRVNHTLAKLDCVKLGSCDYLF